MRCNRVFLRSHTLASVPAAVLLATGLSGASPALAQSDASTVVVTGSVVQRAAEEAPYAITVVGREALREAGPMVNLSEVMARVPGVVVANRSNYAQDLQISSRGFGARAGFGVRGLRLYSDGIPATMPDGQGQVSHFDLAGAERIEVLRGPFSVLYGNSSGGVIAAYSAAPKQARGEVEADLGSFGLRQLRLGLEAPLGNGFDVRAGVSNFELEGFRAQSEASKKAGNVRLGWTGTADRVVVVVNHLNQPALDPLGLSRADFNANPRQTATQATQFNTRKSLEQSQFGLNWRHRFDHDLLREGELTGYAGQREVASYLAIAPATQGAPRHGGGLVSFARDYNGVDARLRWALGAVDVVTGVAVERQTDDRQGYENFTGSAPNQVLGVQGRLRRDEVNRAESQDAYLQADWVVTKGVVFSGGVRSGEVKLASVDRFITPTNGNDSGDLSFSYTNPVLGLRWELAPRLNLHASVARGFESPTLTELAYRPDGTGGFNAALKAQSSRQAEMGLKWRGTGWAVDAAVFSIDTDNEIGVATNAGGRSAFQNVGRTRRTGAEFGVNWALTPAWQAQMSATVLDATYRDGFLACAGIPCTAPTLPIPAGNRIAGTQRLSGFAELLWKPAADIRVGAEWRAASNVVVNDSNSDAAGGYGLLNLKASKRYAVGSGKELEVLLRLDNATDRAYAGSVIVNDGNGRFFETGAPRSWFLAARLTAAL